VVKSYPGREAKDEWLAERNSNLLYKHPRIMPLQASIRHGDNYMNIYPYAEYSLDKLFEQEAPEREHLRENPRKIWAEFKEVLSALDHIHASLSTDFGYHFDLKPANILARKGKWMIADLGLAHRRPTDKGTSQTNRKPCSDEFAPSEAQVNRKFDIWGVACVGCIVMVWLDGGVKAVEEFRRARQHDETSGGIRVISYNFYCKKQRSLQPAVDRMLTALGAKDELSRKVAGILREMLSYDPAARPDAKLAEEKFAAALNLATTKVEKPEKRRSLPVDSNGHLTVPGMQPVNMPPRQLPGKLTHPSPCVRPSGMFLTSFQEAIGIQTTVPAPRYSPRTDTLSSQAEPREHPRVPQGATTSTTWKFHR
jgi:serine/threonine protein kinase